MNYFGEAVRNLMEQRGVSGQQLAEAVGITPTSVSRILNGQSRPRQVTLTRLMESLCDGKSEQQALLRAYSGLEALPEEQALSDEQNARLNEERVKRFLEVKTQSILFKRSVARELDKAGIEYQMDYCKGTVSTDFLVKAGGKRIALECRFNVQRDFERAVITAKLLREALDCNKVITVVPFDLSDNEQLPSGFTVVTPGELVGELEGGK